MLDVRCRWAEKLAVKLGTPLNLPSRLGSAMVQVLSTAVGSGGHTYLPWRVVTQEAERLLQSTGQSITFFHGKRTTSYLSCQVHDPDWSAVLG